jgi:hypothetical protein
VPSEPATLIAPSPVTPTRRVRALVAEAQPKTVRLLQRGRASDLDVVEGAVTGQDGPRTPEHGDFD